MASHPKTNRTHGNKITTVFLSLSATAADGNFQTIPFPLCGKLRVSDQASASG